MGEYKEKIKLVCNGFANQLYCRYNAPVYLVGSSLYEENPRDVDIVVEIPDKQFEHRYGSIVRWEALWGGDWGEGKQKWAMDVAKLSSVATNYIKENIDFKVYPISFCEEVFKGKPKERIDTIELRDRDGFVLVELPRGIFRLIDPNRESYVELCGYTEKQVEYIKQVLNDFKTNI